MAEASAACCAQQTGMHILVVEALLIATYSTWGRANTYTHMKTLSVENLSRANSWSLSSCACPCPAVPVQLVPAQLGLSPAGPYQLWCTSLRIATDTRPTRNTSNGEVLGPRRTMTRTLFFEEIRQRPNKRGLRNSSIPLRSTCRYPLSTARYSS